MKINVTISRYRIYKVLKWIFVGVAIIWSIMNEIDSSPFRTFNPVVVLIYVALGIFFKLQEDSNKPTVEE